MRIAAAHLLLVVLCHSAAAQAGRTNRVVCAEEAPISARANAQGDETTVERSNRETRKAELLWSVPRWLNVVRITEDGSSILVESQSTLQLQTNPTRETVLLAMYRRGQLVREFTAAEVLSSAVEFNIMKDAPAWAKRLPSFDTSVARYLLASGRTVRVNLSTTMLASE
jgi:hypothetical protein